MTKQGVPNQPAAFIGLIDTGSGMTCVSREIMKRVKDALKFKNRTIEPIAIVRIRGIDGKYLCRFAKSK